MLAELTTVLALAALAVLRLGVPILVIVLLSLALRRIEPSLA
jgi:hypothetical protein